MKYAIKLTASARVIGSDGLNEKPNILVMNSLPLYLSSELSSENTYP